MSCECVSGRVPPRPCTSRLRPKGECCFRFRVPKFEFRDPYNGSTPDRFDSVMNSLPEKTHRRGQTIALA